MFKNREFAIRVRKDEKSKTEPVTTIENELLRKEAHMRIAQKLLITVATAVYGYVLVDTYRQVTVAQNTYDLES